MVDHAVQHGLGDAPAGAAFLLDHPGGGQRVELADEPHRSGTRRHERDRAGVQARYVEQRAGHELTRRERVGGRRSLHEAARAVEEGHREQRADVAVRVHRALRAAGRARRVQDERGVVVVDVGLGQLRVGVRVPERVEPALHLDDGHAGIGAFEAREPARVGDEQLRIAVADAVADLGAGRPPVESDRDRTEADRRPERDDPLGRVGAEDRDAIAAADAVVVAQHGRGRCDEPLVLGEREPSPGVAVGEREVFGVAEATRADEQIAQAARARLEHRHALAEHVGLFELERAARARAAGRRSSPSRAGVGSVHAGRTIATLRAGQGGGDDGRGPEGRVRDLRAAARLRLRADPRARRRVRSARAPLDLVLRPPLRS